MKNMKKALALILVFAMLFVVAGCGNKDDGDSGSKAKYTAREVADKMIEATSKVKSVQNDITCKIDIKMSIGAEGESFDMDMKMDMAMQNIISTDPVAGYFKNEMTMDAMGMNETTTEIVYVVEEDGELVSYTYYEYDESWERSSAADEYADKLTEADGTYNYLKEMKDEDLTLAKKTEEVDGKETYVLSFTISGDLLEEMGMDMEELMGTGMDVSSLSFPMTLYIDTETFLPVRGVTAIDGLSDFFNSMMKESMGDLGAELTVDVKCEDFVSIMTYDVEVPAVPAEAKN